jgi:hypothetical protein
MTTKHLYQINLCALTLIINLLMLLVIFSHTGNIIAVQSIFNKPLKSKWPTWANFLIKP